MGEPTPAVRDYLVQAYVHGATVGCAENVQLEGSTAVFTKRRLLGKCVLVVGYMRIHVLLVEGGTSGQDVAKLGTVRLHVLFAGGGVSMQDIAMLGTGSSFVDSLKITHTV